MKKISVIAILFLLLSSLTPYVSSAEVHMKNIEQDNEIVEEEMQDVESDFNINQVSEDEIEETEISEESVVEEEKVEIIESDSNEEVDFNNVETNVENPENDKEVNDKDKVKIKNTATKRHEFNEFGIRKGTMVYGEDISELSEWELQYIPEGWRDGVVESEHSIENEDNQSQMRLFQAYPNVNSYIKSNNFKSPNITYDHKDFFTKFNYRYGFGHIEGIVAHETANNKSTIDSEIAYMSRNHKNAFVHAFVDHNKIIEIHPPELGAWGAGRFANQRFIHVELVRVHNFNDFAKSINNYSEYIAFLLYKYNLGVTDADKNGNGSLWSHRAVSNFLGGTTHVDPHGYFEKWGYNWNDFVNLVKSKYNTMVANEKQYTSKLGHIRTSNVRIYEDPMNLQKYKTAGSSYTNEVYYINQEAVINGISYYLLNRHQNNKDYAIGWIRASDVSAQKHIGVDWNNKDFVIVNNGKAYNKAWGGSKNLVYNNLNPYVGSNFKVNLIEAVGNNVWFRGTLGGKTVWVNSNVVSNEATTSRLGHLRNSSVNIYPQLGNTSNRIIAGTKYTNQVYYIKKQAVINEELYYLISNNPSSVNGVIGWVKSDNLSTHSHVGIDKNEKSFYLKGSGGAYSRAWGGSKDLVYKSLSNYKNQEFKVNLTESVGNNVWYRGKLNGKTVWIHSSQVLTEEQKSTSRLGHLRNASVKIYPYLGNESTAITASKYTNAVYYIKKQTMFNGQLYYLISKSPSSETGVVGWVKSIDLTTHPHKGIDKHAKTFYLKGSGSAYTKIWGGSNDLVYKTLSDYKNQEFKVNLTESVGSNVWYRGKLNGKTVWVHSSYVTTKEEEQTSRLGHIRNSGVKIYSQLGNESSAIPAGGTYTNRVYYIKKQAKINNQLFYLVSNSPSSVNGVIGWVKSEDLSSHPHVGVDKVNKKFIIRGNGSAYSKAWGGSKDLVYKDLSSFKNQEFKVHLTERVGNNIWYRGTLNGKTVWIHPSYLK